MANYEGNGRSNYVAVTDVAAFKSICEKYNLKFINKPDKGVSCYALDESGSPTRQILDEDGDVIEDYGEKREEFFDEVKTILQPDSVFIWQHIGNEGQRYYNAYAITFNSKGERAELRIDDIIYLAAKLGKNVSEATY